MCHRLNVTISKPFKLFSAWPLFSSSVLCGCYCCCCFLRTAAAVGLAADASGDGFRFFILLLGDNHFLNKQFTYQFQWMLFRSIHRAQCHFVINVTHTGPFSLGHVWYSIYLASMCAHGSSTFVGSASVIYFFPAYVKYPLFVIGLGLFCLSMSACCSKLFYNINTWCTWTSTKQDIIWYCQLFVIACNHSHPWSFRICVCFDPRGSVKCRIRYTLEKYTTFADSLIYTFMQILHFNSEHWIFISFFLFEKSILIYIECWIQCQIPRKDKRKTHFLDISRYVIKSMRRNALRAQRGSCPTKTKKNAETSPNNIYGWSLDGQLGPWHSARPACWSHFSSLAYFYGKYCFVYSVSYLLHAATIVLFSMQK